MNQEIQMLFSHCQHDSGFLKCVLQDYVRLRALEAEEWGRAAEAMSLFNELIREVYKKELEGDK